MFDFWKREFLLKLYSCLEEELFRGDRLIWRALVTDYRQNDDLIANKIKKL
jgi:hypothetical protein